MFSRKPFFMVSLFLACLCLRAGTAGAEDNRPRTQPAAGAFRAAPVDVKRRLCEGQDGPYLEVRGRFAGVITSSDPRLSGAFEFTAEPALVNLATGFGTFQGRLRITDPATGMQKAEGKYHNVVTEASLSHGFAFGKVMNQATGESDSFFTSFKANFDAALNVNGQFGGMGDPRTPGVVQGGHCSGPFN